MAEITKTLANCSFDEFFAQTNKIRKLVEKWLEALDFKGMREKLPAFPEGATAEELAKQKSENNRAYLHALLEALFEENAELTKELLCALCFVEYGKRNEHSAREYIKAANDLINDQVVVDFFMSLAALGRINMRS